MTLIGKIAAHSAYEMFSCYKYLIVSLVFSHLGFWSGNLFLIFLLSKGISFVLSLLKYPSQQIWPCRYVAIILVGVLSKWDATKQWTVKEII